MYSAVIDSEVNKARNAPVEIAVLKRALTSEGPYSGIDFETEIDYLIEAGYFKRYGIIHVIPTVSGMNKIWGVTTNTPKETTATAEEDVFILRPEIYGLGVNLKALWNKLKIILKI